MGRGGGSRTCFGSDGEPAPCANISIRWDYCFIGCLNVVLFRDKIVFEEEVILSIYPRVIIFFSRGIEIRGLLRENGLKSL
jgi:hypothetical protein